MEFAFSVQAFARRNPGHLLATCQMPAYNVDGPQGCLNMFGSIELPLSNGFRRRNSSATGSYPCFTDYNGKCCIHQSTSHCF